MNFQLATSCELDNETINFNNQQQKDLHKITTTSDGDRNWINKSIDFLFSKLYTQRRKNCFSLMYNSKQYQLLNGNVINNS